MSSTGVRGMPGLRPRVNQEANPRHVQHSLPRLRALRRGAPPLAAPETSPSPLRVALQLTRNPQVPRGVRRGTAEAPGALRSAEIRQAAAVRAAPLRWRGASNESRSKWRHTHTQTAQVNTQEAHQRAPPRTCILRAFGAAPTPDQRQFEQVSMPC